MEFRAGIGPWQTGSGAWKQWKKVGEMPQEFVKGHMWRVMVGGTRYFEACPHDGREMKLFSHPNAAQDYIVAT